MASARHALRKRREQRGLTQEHAASEFRVAVSTFRSWERGEKMPRIGYRPRLARLLDVSLAEVDAYLPLTAGVFGAACGAFQVLTAPGADAPYMTWVEGRVGPHHLDRTQEIEAHASLFQYLSEVALPPADSVELLRSVAKEKYR